MDETKMRSRLEQMLADLDSSRQSLGDANTLQDTGELSHVDQHPADVASELQAAESEGALIDHVETQRQQIVAALERLDSGTFGRCADCGKELTEERLDARPEAARCVDCQHALELAR